MPNQKTISRRKFLKIAGISAGTAVLACGGLSALAVQAPPVNFYEKESQGVNNMQDKVLVAYASKAGSTSEVANAIGEVLTNKGHAVDVKLVKDVKDLSSYKAVILGSAIRIGHVLPEVQKFVQANQTALSQVLTSYFVVCLTMHEDTEENRRTVSAYLAPLSVIVKPASEGLFAGKMDLSKLSFLDQTMAKMIKAPIGDFRNWDAIRSWAAQAIPTI
jgi:menaquinone-dependent protoporphyrinogen oxidase